MNFEEIIENLIKKFPQLPKPSYWDKHELKRYYFNKSEDNQDYTFFIDITNTNNVKVSQKQNALWHSDYPERQELVHFLNQLMGKNQSKSKNLQDCVLSEFFQINAEKLGKLYPYRLTLIGGNSKKIGGKLSYRMQSKFNCYCTFSDELLLSNLFIEEEKMNKFVEELWVEEPDIYKNLNKIIFLKDTPPTVKSIADFTANFLKAKYKKGITSILERYKEQEAKIKIKKECIIRGWSILNFPAISVSIKSKIYYEDTFDKFMESIENKEYIINFPVIDIELEHTGKITGTAGSLKDHRKRLASITKRERIKQKILEAPDDKEVLIIDGEYFYPTSTLYPVVITKNAHLFSADTSKLMSHLTLSPEFRNLIENEIISLFNEYIQKNFNSKNFPELFKNGDDIGFKNLLKFKDETIHSEEEYILKNLKEHGIYKLSSKFEKNPTIKIILLLGTAFNRYNEFWEHLNKELIDLGFIPQLKSVIKIERLSSINIENKVRLISNKDYDIIIAILPETSNQDKVYEIVKSALFNINLIKSQFIFDKTIRQKLKWALANVILGILAKTENIPYILASPLEFTDYFVGIDISREKKRKLPGSQNYAATARFYAKDGSFSHYEIQEDQIEGETLPKVVLEKIFAKSMFQKKTIMIHRDGFFRGDEISYLKELGEKYGINFQFVEVIKRNVPRLYNIANQKFLNPEKNQIFYLSDKEAILVNNEVKGTKTANPLRIRVSDSSILNKALISIMALRMMHFGTTKTPKLPVTISFSDRISGFARRGIKPPNKSGNIPWWY